MADKKVAIAITAVCGALIVAHLLYPTFGIDGVTVALVVLAALPWLLPFLKSLELPGGVKIEFNDVKPATDKITSEPQPLAADSRAALRGRAAEGDSAAQLKYIANQDPNLALVGFRIELEKRLRQIAKSRQIDVSKMTLRATARELQARQVLSPKVADGIIELAALGNSAAHGVEVSPAASQWVADVGPGILEQLDALESINA